MAADSGNEIRSGEWLCQVGCGARFDGLFPVLRLILAGDEHHGQADAALKQGLVQLEAGKPGQLDIQNQEGGFFRRIRR
jgi:hypothetical protein